MPSATITAKLQLQASVQNWKPHDYQKRAMKFLLEHACAGLFLDPGLGKSSITLGSIRELKWKGMFRRALVIAPLRVCWNVWPEEAKKWEQFTGLSVAVCHGSDKEKTRAVESESDVVCINPEGLPWLLQKNRYAEVNACTLVVDESSKFKNQTSQRFKMLRGLLNDFDRRWILTGSPMPNGYLDIWAQMYILDGGEALGNYVTTYRNRYFYPSGFGGYDWKLKSELQVNKLTNLPLDDDDNPKLGVVKPAEQAIQERIKPYILRMESKDYLKLPKQIVNVVRVNLPQSVRETYDKMEEELFVTLEKGEEVKALSAAAASNKCAQIANGGLYFEEFKNEILERKAAVLHSEKTEAVESIVEEASGVPCIVGYEFNHDMQRLLKAFPKAAVLGGGVGTKEAARTIKAWNAKEIGVLLAHPAAMGHGINLQSGGNHIIFHSVPWDLELYQQFIARVWRQGAAFHSVFIHQLIATATVDEAKLRALNAKDKRQSDFMVALKEYMKGKRK